MTRRRNPTVLLAGILALAGLAIAQGSPAAKPAKTTVCHETHSATKPYVKITVGKVGTEGAQGPSGRHHPGSCRRVSEHCPHAFDGRQEADDDPHGGC